MGEGVMRKVLGFLVGAFAAVVLMSSIGGAGNPSTITTQKVVYLDGVATGSQQLASVTTTGLPNGTRAWVASVGDWFDLGPASGRPDKAFVLVSTPDGRQWKRTNTPNPVFNTAPFWSVSSTGSDEAICWGATQSAADSHPCHSLQEIDRRLVGWRTEDLPVSSGATALTVHVMDDITTANRFAVLHNVHGSADTYVRIAGTLTPVDGSASNRTITAYQAAVPASNTERQLTISGLGLAPQYVGKIIQTTDGAKTAVVMRQTASDILSISEVRDNATVGLDGVTVTNVSDFSVGDQVTIYDAANIPAWPFPPGVPFVLANRLQFVASDEVWPTSDLGNTYALLQQCLVGAGAAGNPTEYEFHGGDPLIIQSSAIFSTHANLFDNIRITSFSTGVLIDGDGPFLDGELSIANEMSIAPYGSGGTGWRCQGEHRCYIIVGDTGTVAAWGMNNSVFILYSTHFGVSGDFVGSDSNTGNKSRFYGAGNAAFGVVLGQGSHCKFPKVGITYSTSGHFLNVAGIGLADSYHNYDVADIPVVDAATLTFFGDSNPSATGGRF